MLRWCVVQTKPREQERAILHLQKQEFEVYAPLLRERRGKEVSLVHMFPGYIFCEIDPLELGWLKIAGTRGVKRIMTACVERPSLLPVGWVEGLRDVGITDLFLDALAFAKGDLVEFTDGAFQGQKGVCQWTSSERVGLLLNLLGRETLVISESRILKILVKKEPEGGENMPSKK